MIWEWITNKEAYIFIAGYIQTNHKFFFSYSCFAIYSPCSNSKRMPIDVLDAFKNVISKNGNKTEDEADRYMKLLENKKRLQLETWS